MKTTLQASNSHVGVVLGLVVLTLVATVAFILGCIAVARLQNNAFQDCWLKREQTISEFARIVAQQDTNALNTVATPDIFFDVSQAGGLPPTTGVPSLTIILDLLATVIRSQTVFLTNTYGSTCPGSARINLLTTQAMDQELNPGDMSLPAIITSAIVEMEFLTSDGKISRFVITSNVQQVIVSPTFAGVQIPPVKKRTTTTTHELTSSDAERWDMLVAWINHATEMGKTEMVTLIKKTPEYARLDALFAK